MSSFLYQSSFVIFLFALRVWLSQPLSCRYLQMFSDYQMQEMSDNFIDSFGFHDDEFTESDENVRCDDGELFDYDDDDKLLFSVEV